MKPRKLFWEEIKKEYPDQWVSLIEVEEEVSGEVKSGVVIASGPDLKVVTEELKRKKVHSDQLEYTGRIKRFLGFAKWDIEDLDHGASSAR